MNELHQAVDHNDIVTVKKLLNKENINIQDKYGQSLLFLAAYDGHIDLVELLINEGANLDTKTEYGSTALMAASIHNNSDVVSFLINSGANLDIQNNKGETALYVAAYEGQLKNIELLIAKNANMDIKDNIGVTPLIISLLNREENIAKLLIQKGAGINCQTNSGHTALINICSRTEYAKDKEFIFYLADKGADFFIENNRGNSAFSILNEKNNLPVDLKSLLEKLTLERLIDENDDIWQSL